MRRAVPLFLLLGVCGFATDYVTIRNGNWHNNVATKTPWATGTCAAPTESLAIPGSGDRVTLCNSFTLHCETGQTCTIGDSPSNDSATPALQNVSATGTGILALDSSCTFIFKGPIRQSNATWTAATGSYLMHDSSAGPGTPNYTWRIGQAPLAASVLRLNGLSGSRILVGAANGSGDFGGFTSGFTNAGQLVASYTDFSHCGTAGSTTACISASLDGTIGSPSFSLDHSTVDASSGGILLSNVSGNAVVSLTSSSFQGRDLNGRAVSLGTGTIAPLTTGTRIFQGNYTNWTIYVGMDMIVQDNFGYISSNTVTNIEGKGTATAVSMTPGNWKNNIFWLATSVANNQASHLPGGTLQRTYFLESSTGTCSTSQNYHWVYMAAVNSVLDSWIFEPDCGASQSNAIQNIAANTGPFSHEVKNSIALPGSNGAGPNLYDYSATGTCDQMTLWCPTVSVHHNTVVATDGMAECGVAAGEAVNWIAGAYSQIANNILWQPLPGTGCIVGWGTPGSTDPANGTFQGADYNWRWNITGGSLYRHLPAYSNPAVPGSHDTSGDPQFVDSTRNFLSWCKSINPADASWADCQGHFADAAFVTHDARYSPAALIEYIRSGFQPQNPASLIAGSDGSYVGAAAPVVRSNDPTVFYTDLDSGPATGGENGGAYVTIYGNNFGSSRGGSRVTFGGGSVASYVSWTNTRIVVQIGPFANTGAVEVAVGGAVSNTNVTFTVRSGRIYFVKTTGNDSDDGDFADPWKTLVQCRKSLAPGDICYVMDGVSQTAQDSFSTALSILSSGAEGRPKAIVAYPGAKVVVGGVAQSGLRPPAVTGAPFEYWTIAGLHLAGGPAGTAIAVAGRGWRVVGNEMTCPVGNGASACVEGSYAMHSKFLGNEVHNAGCGEVATPCAWTNTNTTISSSGTVLHLSAFQSGLSVPDRILVGGQMKRLVSCSDSVSCIIDSPFSPDLPLGTSWQYRDYTAVKLYHSVYYSTDSSDVEIGWNYIHDNHSCRGIQFHSSPTLTAMALASASNTSPIVITFNSAILFKGIRVYISGVSGNQGALGAFFLDPINATSARLWLDKAFTVPSVGTGSGTGGTLANGLNQYDLSVHDNIVTDQLCDGINFATVDPSIGFASVYNNIVYNTGTGGTDGLALGLDTPGGPANYTGFYNSGGTNTGPAGSGTIQVYNNTFYNNGTGGTSGRGAWGSRSGGPSVNFTNNIFYQPSGAGPYVESGSAVETYSGQNNLWYGKGLPPPGFTANVNLDPAFVTPGFNFHLLPDSPAIAAGVFLSATEFDPDGLVRPVPPVIGAFDSGNSLLNGSITLQASPSSLVFNYTVDGLAPAAQSVNVSSMGGLPIDNWTAVTDQLWLSATPAGGSGAGKLQAAIITPTSLTTGTFTGSISVGSATSRVGNSPRTVSVTLEVFPAPQIISGALPGVVAGGSYSETIAATGGQLPYTWSVNPGGLCSGLSLSSAGAISGSATKAGTCHFTAVLTEAGGAVASKSFSIVVNTAAAPVKAAQTVRSGTVNH